MNYEIFFEKQNSGITMKRKIISLVLCLSLVLSAFSLQIAYASDDNLIYKVESGSVTITGFANPSYIGDVEIPELIEGYPVTSISSYAFKNCSSITSVTLPTSITSINNWAFEGCSEIAKTYYNGTLSDWLNISFGSLSANPVSFSHNLEQNVCLR